MSSGFKEIKLFKEFCRWLEFIEPSDCFLLASSLLDNPHHQLNYEAAIMNSYSTNWADLIRVKWTVLQRFELFDAVCENVHRPKPK